MLPTCSVPGRTRPRGRSWPTPGKPDEGKRSTAVSHFVFMLTHGDRTVPHAADIVPTLADTGLRYIGFKDVGADPSRQCELTSMAHDAGFEVMLEVVSTSKEDELSSLRAAAAARVDWVLGGTHAAESAG